MPQQKPVRAYRNQEFINSREGRVLRILSEYMEPQKRLREAGIEDTIVFFGSARIPSAEDANARLEDIVRGQGEQEDIDRAQKWVAMSRYYEAARELAGRLSKWAEELGQKSSEGSHRFSIVTGGGPGIMEAANRGATEAGGRSIGMNISLPFEQYPNEYISDNLAFEFHYFFMRKFWLTYMAKAVVVMPGGFGTFDEFMEILTLIQTEKIKRKMPIILFGKEYWGKIVEFEPLAEFGTISPEDLDLFHITDSVDEAYDWLKAELMEWAVDHPGAGITTDLEMLGRLEG